MFWKKPLMAEYILLTLLEKLRTNGNLKKNEKSRLQNELSVFTVHFFIKGYFCIVVGTYRWNVSSPSVHFCF